MVERTTFTFVAKPKRKLPWDAVSEPGQTVKVILEGQKRGAVLNSAYRWNMKMRDKLELRCKLKAQSFVILEAFRPDPKDVD